MPAKVTLHDALLAEAPMLCGNWRSMHVPDRRPERRWVRVVRRRLSLQRGRVGLVSTPITLTSRHRLWRLARAWKVVPAVTKARHLPMLAVCAMSACRYHLADLARTPLAVSCALAYAERGEMTSAEIENALGMTHQAYDRIEVIALRRRAWRAVAWNSISDGAWNGAPEDAKESVEERILAAVGGDACIADDVARVLSIHYKTALDTLNNLERRGLVAGTHTRPRFWCLVAPAPRGD